MRTPYMMGRIPKLLSPVGCSASVVVEVVVLVLVYGFAVAVPVASSLLVVFVCFGVDVEPSFDSSSTVKSTMCCGSVVS